MYINRGITVGFFMSLVLSNTNLQKLETSSKRMLDNISQVFEEQIKPFIFCSLNFFDNKCFSLNLPCHLIEIIKWRAARMTSCTGFNHKDLASCGWVSESMAKIHTVIHNFRFGYSHGHLFQKDTLNVFLFMPEAHTILI